MLLSKREQFRDGSGGMRLAGTGPANEHDVFGLIEELAAARFRTGKIGVAHSRRLGRNRHY